MLNKLKNIIGIGEKKQLYLLFIITIFSTLIEVLNIGLVIPLLTSIVNFSKINSSELVVNFFIFFDINLTKVNFIYVIISLIFIFSLIRFIFQFIILNKQLKIRNHLFTYFADNLLNFYMSQDWDYHLKNGSSKLIRNVNFESAMVVNQIFLPLISIITELLLLFAIFSLLIFYNFKITIIIFVFILIIFLLIHFLSKPILDKLSKERLFFSKENFKFLHELFNITREIILYQVKKFFINKHIKSFDNYLTIDRKINLFKNSPRIIFELMFVLLFCFFLFITVSFSDQNLNELIIILSLYLAAAIKLIPSAVKINSSIQLINVGKDVLNDLYESLNLKKDIKKESKIEINSFVNEIKLINISFKYPEVGKNILNKINLTIKKNSITCILGESGAGKSTLLDIICSLSNHSDGNFYIDNKLVNSKTHDWKNLIGYVGQNVNLIDDTLIKNIILDSDQNQQNVETAKNLIHKCKLEDLEKSLNKRKNGQIGEDARNISGGEKQRINLARALFKKPEIIVLDEATNALDEITEREIFNLIKDLSKTKTIIIVTHKLELKKFSDYVYQIQEGNLINFS